MDGTRHTVSGEEAGHRQALRIAQVDGLHPDPVGALVAQLPHEPYALVCLFVCPVANFRQIAGQASRAFGKAEVIACTTAGEIGRDGYEEDQIIAVAFPSAQFSVACLTFPDLSALDQEPIIDGLIRTRMSLMQDAPERVHEFAFLLVDGLSRREEMLTDVLASGLGPVPLFGGSSGDGTRFEQTWVAANGQVMSNAGVLAIIRSTGPVRVFSLDHLDPSDDRMVVTDADPERRIVREINAEPAAAEYARLLGKDPTQLDPFTFAAHPVCVRVGDTHHVRAIQRVNEAGELVFFSAINEGMVLTLAEHKDIAGHLDEALARFEGAPQILGCDCLLRRIAAGQTQQTHEISRILARHRVIGFSTYGEQIGALHVNQTLTGVAIWTPEDAPASVAEG